MEKSNLQIKLLKQLISFNLNRHTDTGSSSLLPGIVRVPRTNMISNGFGNTQDTADYYLILTGSGA